MSKGIHFPTRILQLATVWRTGAQEMRDRYLADGKVPAVVETGAMAMETCADRLETEVREYMQATRKTE